MIESLDSRPRTHPDLAEMDATEVCALVLDVLGTVAPDGRTMEIRPEINFREQFDLDSLDY